MTILETRNISHRFQNGTWGIRDISVAIEKGDFLLVTGRNGSGKTVLMKHLNGLLQPSSGSVHLLGREITEDLAWTRRNVGLVFQNPDTQIVGQTVEEDIAFGPENLGLSREEIRVRVEQALAAVNIPGLRHRRTHTLSGGEKKLLTIAGVLAMEPEFIILDEPFTSLDYPGVRQVLTSIVKLHTCGHTVAVITHDIGKVFASATRIIIIDRGAVVFQGTPEDALPLFCRYGIREHTDYQEEARVWMR